MIAVCKEHRKAAVKDPSHLQSWIKGWRAGFSNSVSEEIFIEKLQLKKMFNEKLTVSLAK